MWSQIRKHDTLLITILWGLFIATGIQYLNSNYFFYLGLILQFAEKFYFTHPRAMILARTPFYLLKLVLRICTRNSLYYTSWYWLPLDVFDENRCSGNVASFTTLRYTHLWQQYFYIKSITGLIGTYYLSTIWLNPVHCYFILSSLTRQYLRYYYPHELLDTQIGEIRPRDVKRAMEMTQSVMGNMAQGFMSSFFNEEEREMLQEQMQQFQNGGLAQMFEQVTEVRNQAQLELDRLRADYSPDSDLDDSKAELSLQALDLDD